MLFSANRNGLFDQYQEIKSRPPEGTFDHARLPENSAKVQYCAYGGVADPDSLDSDPDPEHFK
jgi:hypothetical protein